MNDHANKPAITDHEVAVALGAFAHNVEAQMPETDEEILAMFEAMDPATLPMPDIRKFEALLKAEPTNLAGVVARAAGLLEKIGMKLNLAVTASGLTPSQCLPMAARGGRKKITPEMDRKVEAARNNSRKRKRKGPDATA